MITTHVHVQQMSESEMFKLIMYCLINKNQLSGGTVVFSCCNHAESTLKVEAYVLLIVNCCVVLTSDWT